MATNENQVKIPDNVYVCTIYCDKKTNKKQAVII